MQKYCFNFILQKLKRIGIGNCNGHFVLFYWTCSPLCFPISILAPTNTTISIRGIRENLVQIFFFHRIPGERRLAIRPLSMKNFTRIFESYCNINLFSLYVEMYNISYKSTFKCQN